MTSDQIVLLTILVALLGLLIWGRWRFDIVALGALFVAGVFGIIPDDQLFSGFGNPATITVILVLILSFGLTKSGAIEFFAQLIDPVSDKPFLHIATLTFLAAFLSMFMNNVGALALLMPVAIQSTSKAGRSPSSVLMPLSFGSILGGLVTMIGTPPNILISNYRLQETGEAFAMFDFSAVGGGVALAGIVFMLVVGWKLVKVRKKSATLELFDVETYLFELKLTEESDLLDKPLGELRIMLRQQSIDLLSLLHKRRKIPSIQRHHNLAVNDLMMLQGSHEEIDKFATAHDLQLLSAESTRKEILHSEDSQVSEIVVAPGASVEGRTAAQIRFNRRYGVNLLAVSRAGSSHRSRLRDFKLRVGDVLLLHGEAEELQDAISKIGCYPLQQRSLGFGASKKAWPALIIFIVAIASAGFGLVSIQLALGLATVVMGLMSIVPIREFYDGVDWPIVILLGAMIPIGTALEETGTTALLVDAILSITEGLSPVFILALLLIITMTVSDVLNNAATAILMAPIAYNIALSLNLNPDAFLMAIAIGASCAFLTPIGHQNNALVMGPGGYKFGDYWRMGLPLELIIVAVAIPLILLVWPLT
ncbi:MAG: SLC13 family permease [SAR86 cluster bacterium]|uniref:SLC13 family permease n=1 Tax=SAR86 cluster bacterium TaxID=2030880 RepID=A0A2A4MW74_9GAMM|nr:MAG: SLC13 family permease [SAR86 cluster bacterium]